MMNTENSGLGDLLKKIKYIKHFEQGGKVVSMVVIVEHWRHYFIIIIDFHGQLANKIVDQKGKL